MKIRHPLTLRHPVSGSIRDPFRKSVHISIHERDLHCAKEPYELAKEPYNMQKSPIMYKKTLLNRQRAPRNWITHTYQGQRVIYFGSPCAIQSQTLRQYAPSASKTHRQKSPTFRQKSPTFRQKSLCVFCVFLTHTTHKSI